MRARRPDFDGIHGESFGVRVLPEGVRGSDGADRGGGICQGYGSCGDRDGNVVEPASLKLGLVRTVMELSVQLLSIDGVAYVKRQGHMSNERQRSHHHSAE
ncbi:hypothetical protein OAN61_00670 [bacterium]|nr:hypothetical protein [bacterium]